MNMAENNTPAYLDRRQRRTWIGAVLTAAVLNACLFVLMPSLINRESSKPEIAQIVPRVNIVQIPKRVIKKTVAPIAKEIPKIKQKLSYQPQKQPGRKLSLPFSINPKLPGIPTALHLPPPNTALPFDTISGDAFSAEELDTPLTVLTRTPPLYPLRARQRGIEGWVKIKFFVDEQGNVHQIAVLAAQPEGVFEKSVERCVSSWRFQPGTIEGVAVKAYVETTVKFELN